MVTSKLQEECQSRITKELYSIMEARNAGARTAGFLCSGFPGAVAAGLGLRPIRVLQGAASAGEGSVPVPVRPDVCPFVLSILEAAESGSGACGLVDIWFGLATCDQTRRCFAQMARKLPVYNLQFPSTRTEEALGYYQWQMVDLVERLEGVLGVEYSPERALNHSREVHRAFSFLAGIASSGTMPPLDLHMMTHLAMLSRPEGLRETLEEIAGLSREYSPSVRIALTGSILSLADTQLLEILQQREAAVIPLGCTGLQSFPFMGLNRLPESGSPEDLAAEAFRSSRCIRCRPNDSTFDYIRDGIELTESDGLIVKTLKFCDLWFTERERFRNGMDVPVMVMDTTYGDGEALRQENRLEAFLETLLS